MIPLLITKQYCQNICKQRAYIPLGLNAKHLTAKLMKLCAFHKQTQ